VMKHAVERFGPFRRCVFVRYMLRKIAHYR
jgi:hypothetical protein